MASKSFNVHLSSPLNEAQGSTLDATRSRQALKNAPRHEVESPTSAMAPGVFSPVAQRDCQQRQGGNEVWGLAMEQGCSDRTRPIEAGRTFKTQCVFKAPSHDRSMQSLHGSCSTVLLLMCVLLPGVQPCSVLPMCVHEIGRCKPADCARDATAMG